MKDVFKYTKSLIRERRLELRNLELRERTLLPGEYQSCQRSLIQAIEELESLCPRMEYEELRIPSGDTRFTN